MINSVILIGRLTKDCESSYATSGMCICKFSIVQNIYKKGAENDEPHFFDCTLFGKQAESVGKYLIKGQMVAIKGGLRQNKWEKDGQKHSKVCINCDDVQVMWESKKTDTGLSTTDMSTEFMDDIPF